MKVYLAASFSRQLEMRGVRTMLEGNGHQVTSTWLDSVFTSDSETPPEHRSIVAIQNIHDLEEADALVAFTEDTPTKNSSGGRHVELGYALAEAKEIFIVGPRENVFCWHLMVEQCENLDDVVAKLGDC